MQSWTRLDRLRLLMLVIVIINFGLAAPVDAGAARMPLDRLAALVATFAASPGRIDPRLLLPDCAAPVLSWAVPARTVAVDCPAPAWRLNVPVDAPPVAGSQVSTPAPRAAAPLVRRGDRVLVEAAGAGFAVGVAAIAEADSRDGRVALRNIATGTRLTAQLEADGRVVLPGLSRSLSSVVNRR